MRLRGLPALASRRLAFRSLTEPRGSRRYDWRLWIICFSHNSVERKIL
jgi:hypothetical protein